MTKYLNSIYRVIIYVLKALNKLHFVVFSSFHGFAFSLFRFFVLSLFRLFVISSFRMALFRLFVFLHAVVSHGDISPRKDEITPGKKTTRRKTPNISFKWRLYAWLFFVFSR